MNDSTLAAIECRNLSKTYDEGPAPVKVLNNVNFKVERGETVAVVGASGAGKSTLLHILGGLDLPTSGEVLIRGRVLSGMSDAERGTVRNKELGFVYQFHHLLPEFTALENVAMPLMIGRVSQRASTERATTILDRVGLTHRLDHKPSELSGGERQRAAIARALVTRPSCLLADEPTGNLDEGNADQIYDLMLEMNKEFGTSLILVTHNRALAARMDRVITLHSGGLGS